MPADAFYLANFCDIDIEVSDVFRFEVPGVGVGLKQTSEEISDSIRINVVKVGV